MRRSQEGLLALRGLIAWPARARGASAEPPDGRRPTPARVRHGARARGRDAARRRRARPPDVRRARPAHGARLQRDDRRRARAARRDLPRRRPARTSSTRRGPRLRAQPPALEHRDHGRLRASRPLAPAPRSIALAIMGGVGLDLRDATIESDELVITAIAVMGGVDVTVPEGVDVQLGGFALWAATTTAQARRLCGRARRPSTCARSAHGRRRRPRQAPEEPRVAATAAAT